MSRYNDARNYNPDHGENFVPGSEAAPNLAPQALDHFKRGYRERTNQRERDYYGDPSGGENGGGPHREAYGGRGNGGRDSYHGSDGGTRNDGENFPRRRGSSSYHGGGRGRGGRGRGGRESGRPYRGDSNAGFRGGGRGDRRPSYYGDRDDRGGGRGGQQIIMGLDIQALVDRLVRPGCDVYRELNGTKENNMAVFQSGKAVTAIISNLARRRNLRIANVVWDWIDESGIQKNTFHYNSMISACEKVRDYNKALRLLDEMKEKKVGKNEVTFSSAISACEKCGQWRIALELLDQMKKEGAGQTAIAYNAAISACEKGLVPHKALEIFEQMKREGVKPTVVTYSALISAAEKGQQWKLALEVLEEMKAAGHGANVIAYSAAISALSKGQMWHKALELFREIEASGGKPSIVTYNATMTALEKGLQWERALDLFDEMKSKNMPVTVVSYGSAISACEKGLQYRQCLEYLDEMTEMGIKKNVIIFGAAMSCMEKSCRADIGFQLMERMRLEDVAPNVHIYNSAISACARCNLWEKGYQLFEEMDRIGVAKDVVTYNAVLDAVSSQVDLGRRLFKQGVEKGFYARVSRLGTQWLELDLHFLSLGGGEIALGWWFEECLVPYLVNTSKLEAVQSISIVTGYGKTRARGARMNDDGMRLRVRAMLKYMDIRETPQPNKGRIHIDKKALIDVVKKNGGRIRFDHEGYTRFKEEETTANKFPDVVQQVRPRFRPARAGQGPPGTFIRDGDPVPPFRSPDEKQGHHDNRSNPPYRDNRLAEHPGDNQNHVRTSDSRNYEQRYGDNWRGRQREPPHRGGFNENGGYDNRGYREDRSSHMMDRRGERPPEFDDRRGVNRNWDGRESVRASRDYNPDMREAGGMNRRGMSDRDGRQHDARPEPSSYYHSDNRRTPIDNRGNQHSSRGPQDQHSRYSDRQFDDRDIAPGGPDGRANGNPYAMANDYRSTRNDRNVQASYHNEDPGGPSGRKRPYDDYQKQQPASRGYDIKPTFAKRRSS